MIRELENKKQTTQINDRKLGDEWIDWRGDGNGSEKDTNTRKRVFLSILLILLLGTGAMGYFIWYLITPRLAQFHSTLPTIFWRYLTISVGNLRLSFFLYGIIDFYKKGFFHASRRS